MVRNGGLLFGPPNLNSVHAHRRDYLGAGTQPWQSWHYQFTDWFWYSSYSHGQFDHMNDKVLTIDGDLWPFQCIWQLYIVSCQWSVQAATDGSRSERVLLNGGLYCRDQVHTTGCLNKVVLCLCDLFMNSQLWATGRKVFYSLWVKELVNYHGCSVQYWLWDCGGPLRQTICSYCSAQRDMNAE